MGTATFTVRWIEALRATGRASYFWDDKQPGLGLRMSAKGRLSFLVQYRVKGSARRPRLVLGPYGTVTLDEARTRARRFVSAGLDGIDLRAERESRRKAEDSRLTFADLAKKWLDLHVQPKRAARTLYDYQKVLRSYLLPVFSERVVEGITRAEVLALHERMKTTPKVGDYAIVVGKAAVNFGIENDLLPASLRNPFAKIELFGQQEREYYLSAPQVAAIGEALAALEGARHISPWAAAAIRMLVFTGARKGEILGLRWDMVDVEQAELRLPKSKTGKKTITLSPAAVEVLKAVPRVAGNHHVIVGQKAGSPMVSIAAPWRSVCREAGILGCRIHDLRHSYASFAAADGQSLLVIGKLLGHSSPRTTARYAHLADDARRHANDRLGKRLEELLNRGRNSR